MPFKSCLLLFSILLVSSIGRADRYKVFNSTISFVSNAPLEIISAKSTELRGVIDAEKKQFGFKVNMNSFKGFNSPLQLEHYNENYIESNKYPEARFFGSILDDFNTSKVGTYQLRVKGQFTLHGITKEKIFLSTLFVLKDGKMKIRSEIELKLDDFGIEIPQIVNHKIAETIKISIDCDLRKI